VIIRSLKNVQKALDPMAAQKDIPQFLNDTENAQRLSDLVGVIFEAMLEYQVCAPNGLALIPSDIVSEFLTTKQLRHCPSVNRESFIPTIGLRIVIGQQDRADLALLNNMHHVTDAGYLYGDRQGCMRGTRRDVLFRLENWLNGEENKRVFWLNGLAGTGKSAIAQTFAEVSFANGKLGASFFCSRDSADRSSLRSIFPTLAFQLAHQYPFFRRELLPVLRASPDVGRESLCSQMERLIVAPLQATQTQTLIIVDALDECLDEEPASAILSVLSRYIDKIPLVKFFITGRPEPRIRSGFRLESLRPHTVVLRLHEVKGSLVDNDIKLFLKARLSDIVKNRSNYSFTEDWPSPQDIDILCKEAAGFFIYASTVVKFVGSPDHPPNERLSLITSPPPGTSHEGKSGIDFLYTQVLEQALRDGDKDSRSHFKPVVGAVLLVLNPLSINTLSDLLRNCGTPSRIYSTLRNLHSLLLIPDSLEDPVRIFHKSFPAFLTDPSRCTDKQFFIDPPIHHREILLSCLDVMKRELKRNICQLDDHVLLSEIKDLPERRTTYIGSALEYACRFWANHLMMSPSSGPGEEVCKAVDEFFTTRLLFWIEVLSLMGKLDAGVYAINYIRQRYTSVSCKRSPMKPVFRTFMSRLGRFHPRVGG